MKPGEHFWVIGTDEDATRTRGQGMQLRDTALILTPGPKTLAAYLFRNLPEGTIMENVLKYGTGGLDINACRITTSDNLNGGAYSGGSCPEHFFGLGRKTHEEYQPPAGRWPPNLLIVHGTECEKTGTRKIPGCKGFPNGPGGASMHYSSDKLSKEVRPNPWPGHADPEGNETIDTWRCRGDCPARLLDGQSGESRSAHGLLTSVRNAGSPYEERGGWYNPDRVVQWMGYGDAGGASRFFPQFGTLAGALVWLCRLVGVDPLVG